jgi:ribosomal protein S18 acetylase RimI-like enzyme
MPLVDITERAGEADLRSLLSVLAWTGEPGHIDRIISAYVTGLRLFGMERGSRLEGVIGIEVVHKGEGVIRHIAVEPAARRSGIGRAMVDEAMDRLALLSLAAETDRGAVLF